MLYAIRAMEGYSCGQYYLDSVVEVANEDEARKWAEDQCKQIIVKNKDLKQRFFQENNINSDSELLNECSQIALTKLCMYRFSKLDEKKCSASLDYLNSLSYNEVVSKWSGDVLDNLVLYER